MRYILCGHSYRMGDNMGFWNMIHSHLTELLSGKIRLSLVKGSL